MKKVLIIITIMLICLMPVTTFADGPVPYKNDANYVYIDDSSDVLVIEIWGNDSNNNEFLITRTEYTDKMRTANRWTEWFSNKNGKYKSFQLVITHVDGKKTYSNFVDIIESGGYDYSAEDNTLHEGYNLNKGYDYSSNMSLFKGLGLRFLPFALIIPLLFTVLVEWIIALFFKLKPGKYVVGINFITNPVLNILLMLFSNSFLGYTLLLVIFEAIAAGAEFWFYTLKYKAYAKKRLLLFTLVANATSWGLYSLFTMLIGL